MTVPELNAQNSLVHKVVDSRPVRAEREVVSDAYREGLEDHGFFPNQARMRAPLGYDAQAKIRDETGAIRVRDEVMKTEGGRYSFSEIRSWSSQRRHNDRIECDLRKSTMQKILGEG